MGMGGIQPVHKLAKDSAERVLLLDQVGQLSFTLAALPTTILGITPGYTESLHSLHANILVTHAISLRVGHDH